MGLGARSILTDSVPHNAKRRGVTRGVSPLHQMLEIYFDTDFLNMRSIFSLIASMAVEFDWEVDNA